MKEITKKSITKKIVAKKATSKQSAEIKKIKAKIDTFAKAAKLVQEYLKKNHNPHVIAIVSDRGAELLSGFCYTMFKNE